MKDKKACSNKRLCGKGDQGGQRRFEKYYAGLMFVEIWYSIHSREYPSDEEMDIHVSINQMTYLVRLLL